MWRNAFWTSQTVQRSCGRSDLVFGFQVGFWSFFIYFPGIVNIPVRTWVYQDFQIQKIEQLGAFRGFEDAISGSNPWMYCNGNDNGVGFPRCRKIGDEELWVVYFCLTGRSNQSQFLFSHYIGTYNIVHFRDFKRWTTFNETSSDLGSHRYQHFGVLRLLESLIPFWQKNIVFGIQFSNI